jgi:hypothetical protein
VSYYDVDEDLRSPQGAFIARRDVEQQNRKNKEKFTPNEIDQGIKFKDMVDNAFFRRRTFLNYRETFMTVKIEAPQSVDKFSQEYRDVMAFAKNNNYIIKNGRASIIFELCHK